MAFGAHRELTPPRAVVRHFAEAMEAELREHDAAKGDWRETSVYTLLDAAHTELRELDEAVSDFRAARMTHEVFNAIESDDSGEDSGEDSGDEGMRGMGERILCDARAAVRSEAADLALYALMIADACGALPFTGPRDGRGRALTAVSSSSATSDGANPLGRCVDCGGARVVGDGWPCPTCSDAGSDIGSDADAYEGDGEGVG